MRRRCLYEVCIVLFIRAKWKEFSEKGEIIKKMKGLLPFVRIIYETANQSECTSVCIPKWRESI